MRIYLQVWSHSGEHPESVIQACSLTLFHIWNSVSSKFWDRQHFGWKVCTWKEMGEGGWGPPPPPLPPLEGSSSQTLAWCIALRTAGSPLTTLMDPDWSRACIIQERHPRIYHLNPYHLFFLNLPLIGFLIFTLAVCSYHESNGCQHVVHCC